jgi:hypothetical protein
VALGELPSCGDSAVKPPAVTSFPFCNLHPPEVTEVTKLHAVTDTQPAFQARHHNREAYTQAPRSEAGAFQ